VEIQGGALLPGPVNLFLNKLSEALERTDLSVGKAELSTTADGQSYYDWVIRTRGLIESAPETEPAGPFNNFGGSF
jgi:hypothetical protein